MTATLQKKDLTAFDILVRKVMKFEKGKRLVEEITGDLNREDEFLSADFEGPGPSKEKMEETLEEARKTRDKIRESLEEADSESVENIRKLSDLIGEHGVEGAVEESGSFLDEDKEKRKKLVSVVQHWRAEILTPWTEQVQH